MPDRDSNVRDLADTAYRGKNYQQAYDYYSRLLEENTSDSFLWLRKGLSAGWLSTSEEPRLDEMEVCLERAREEGLPEEVSPDEVIDEEIQIGKALLDSLYEEFDRRIQEFEKRSTFDDQLQPTREFEKVPEKLKQGHDLAPVALSAIDTMYQAAQEYPSVSRFRTVLDEIDRLIQHSVDNTEYLTTHKDAGDRYERLKEKRSNVISSARELDSSFTAEPLSKAESSSGCFLATAAYSNPAHPDVMTFRRYRDAVLQESVVGRALVRFYYCVGPLAARIVRKSSVLSRGLRRFLLVPLAKAIRESSEG